MFCDGFMAGVLGGALMERRMQVVSRSYVSGGGRDRDRRRSQLSLRNRLLWRRRDKDSGSRDL